nr:PAS domain S-box protein [uncultured Desulfobulbus sp.]
MNISTKSVLGSFRVGLVPTLFWLLLCSVALVLSLRAEARTLREKASPPTIIMQTSGADAMQIQPPVEHSPHFVAQKYSQQSMLGEVEQAVAFILQFRATAMLFLGLVLASLGLLQARFYSLRQNQQLAQHEQRFFQLKAHKQSLMQSPWTGLILTNCNAEIIEINTKASSLTGWSQEEALGKPVHEVMNLIDHRGNAYSPLEMHLEQTTELPLLLTPTGDELHIALEIAPFGLHTDQKGDWIIRFRDQSDTLREQQRVQARLSLREYSYPHGITEFLHRAMEELATLVGSPRGVCCSLEKPYHAVAVEQRTTGEKGKQWSWYDAEAEPICRYIQSRGDDPSLEVELVDPSLETSEKQKGIVQQRPLSLGTQRELLLPLVRGGRLVAVIALADKGRPYTLADIDTVVELGEYIWRIVEQKQMEEELLASERRYRSLYTSMMDAFVVTDLKGCIRECNQAYADMIGLRPEDVKGRVARDFTPEPWQQYEYEHIRKQLMHGGCSELYEKEYRHQDGHTFPVELRTYLLVNNEGQPEGMSAVVRDISQRKQVQAEREKLRDRLNLAKRLESVGQLAGGVAHDFNNMLGVIIGFADLALRRLDLQEPLDMYLQEISTAAKRSAEVTRQLLAFARQQTIEPKVLDFNATVHARLAMLRQLIGENRELCWQPGKELWPVQLDPSQLDQILINLVVNARDAINGVGIVTLETLQVSLDESQTESATGLPAGDYVVLAVSDTGSGIDPLILDKIFEPFFTTKAQGQGTGLGLATVYGIVQQNQGGVQVQSEVDAGTTFRVYLPRFKGKSEEERAKEGAAFSLGQGELVLMVEDEPALLSLHKTILEQLNYKVLTAVNPAQALTLANKHGDSVDLLLLGLPENMPEVTSRELAVKLGKLCPQSRIVFLSDHDGQDLTWLAKLDSDAAVLNKPLVVAELAQLMREALRAA